MDTVATVTCILLSPYVINGQLIDSTTIFSPSELTNPNGITNITGLKKNPLRYGFHRTADCNNYEKAFLCIQKCLDKGYNLAYSDKHCFCTCYVNRQKAKYTSSHHLNSTTWKLGTPKTKKPAWIKKLEHVEKKTTGFVKVIKKPEVNKQGNISCAGNETQNIGVESVKNLTDSRNASNVIGDQNNVDINNDTILTEDKKLDNHTNESDNAKLNGSANRTEDVTLSGTTNRTENEKLSVAANGITDGTKSIGVTNDTDDVKLSDATNATAEVKLSDINVTKSDVINVSETKT